MSVSVGDPATAVNIGALAELLSGAPGVQERMEAYKKAKAEAEAALKALKLGRDAQTAYDDAVAKQTQVNDLLDETKKDRAEASARLDDAQKLAASIVESAEKEKARVLNELASQRSKLEAEWAATDKATKKRKGEIDKAVAEANAARDAAEEAVRAADAAEKAARAAQKKAKDAEGSFKAKAAELTSALAKLTEGA